MGRIIALALITLALAITMPIAISESEPSLDAKLISNSVIDLADPEKDRVIRTYAQFENFAIDDGSFKMYITTAASQVVLEYDIKVYSTASGLVDFNSHVLHIVTDEMIEDGQAFAGDFNMIISNNDGTLAKSIPFSILDSRE